MEYNYFPILILTIQEKSESAEEKYTTYYVLFGQPSFDFVYNHIDFLVQSNIP